MNGGGDFVSVNLLVTTSRLDVERDCGGNFEPFFA
jgi:hypothetical protein